MGRSDGLLTSASIDASPPLLWQGGTVLFDGHLKVGDDYGVLVNNALADRTVQLQRSTLQWTVLRCR
ncbi:MAG: hypothetical protein H0V36_05725 [Chloroflexi bacterium]|nr:hypothetical protein [Chloroflexota bacterium]